MWHLTYYMLIIVLLIIGAVLFVRQTPWGDFPNNNSWMVPLQTEDTGNRNTQDNQKTPAPASENRTDIPLTLPAGFSFSYFAKNLSWPRVLAIDPAGNIVVSLTKAGKVAILPDRDRSGTADETKIILSGLSGPHGLLFTGTGTQTKLYVAETNKIIRYDYDVSALTANNPKKIHDLPWGGRHVTRTLLSLPDGNILVSIGSSCDACIEKNPDRASILVMKPDGTEAEKYADWLRNSVFMRLHPKTDEVWATEMGRDFLGDDLPPDEINIIRRWGFYGWPYCYGNKIPDTSFGSMQWREDICGKSIGSFVDIPAHSAPLGLAFVPGNWPQGYVWNLLVAYHGSWNRSTRTGYKIVLMKFDQAGKYTGTENFITGWLSNWNVHGRPVDLLFGPDGTLYISDDSKGVIYRLARNR